MDEAIAAKAARQKGRIATRQLRAIGLNADDIHYRARVGRLHCLERGVYAVGHLAAIPDAPWMTKLLRAGPGAVLSNRAAGAQWNVRPSSSPTADITVPRRRRLIEGVRFHVASLPEDEVTVHDDFPITTVPRTLLDLAGVLGEAELEVAIGTAEDMRLTDPLSLPDLIDRYPRRRGVARLRRALDRLGEGGLRIRRELERRFYLLVAEGDLPRPGTNVSIRAGDRTYECDAVWPEARLIVELDGRTHHQRRAAMESDRERDRKLAAAGWTVIRITWRQIHDDPAAVLADLEALI